MAIQMRQGNEVDFDVEKMLPGEWAVSTDARIVRMCFAQGIVIRMATYEAFEADMEQIRDVLAEAKTTEEAIERIRDEIHDTEIMVENYALSAKSYAVGSTGVRDDEDTDNAKYYYEQSKRIVQGVNGIVPMGTITFEELPTGDVVNNAMYNISNAFTSDERFNDGGGVYYGAGNNVVWTASGKWDVTAASGVTGIKGENEIDYRQGNVNITRDNIGLGDDVFGTADISSIGDGTVKGAILFEGLRNLQTANYNGLLNDALAINPTDSKSDLHKPYFVDAGGGTSNMPGDCAWGVREVYFINNNMVTVKITGISTDGVTPNVWMNAFNMDGWKGWSSNLPLTGGTLSGVLYTGNGTENGHGYINSNTGLMQIGITNEEKNFQNQRNLNLYTSYTELKDAFELVDVVNNVAKIYKIFGQHNKPHGTYTGSGSNTPRTINTGGIGKVLHLWGNGYCGFVTLYGFFYWHNSSEDYGHKYSDNIAYKDGVLTIASSDARCNASGMEYGYQCL